MQSDISNKEYPILDVMKFFLAICIVAMHTEHDFLGRVGGEFMILAVPLFFLISGFLLARKFDGENELARIRNYGIHIIRIYVMWTIIYLPMVCLYYYYNKVELWKIPFFFARDFFFWGGQWYSRHLWYLLATLYTIGLLWWLKKKNVSNRIIFFMACISYIVGYIVENIKKLSMTGEKLTGVEYFIYNTVRDDGLFTGFFYISVAVIMTPFLKKIIETLGAVIIIGTVALFVYHSYACNGHLYAPLIPFVVIMVFLSLLKVNLKPRKYYKYMRVMTTIIYCSHNIFVFIWQYGLSEVWKQRLNCYYFTVICSLLLSVVLMINKIFRPKSSKLLE